MNEKRRTSVHSNAIIETGVKMCRNQDRWFDIDVKIVSKYDNATGTHSSIDYSENGLNRIPDGSTGPHLP